MKFEQIKQWYIDNDAIFYASFELTQQCNFLCKHCYCPDKKTKNMSLEDAKRVVDKLYDVGCFLLILTGGEILTCEYFEELYIYAKRKGFMIDLMTNGSLINERIVSLFKTYPPHSISITVYGTNEEEYQLFTGNARNYEKVMRALEMLKKNNVEFNIRTVATRILRDSIQEGRFDLLADKFKVPFRYDPIIFPKISGEKTPLNECMTPEEIVQLECLNELRTNKWKSILEESKTFQWKCRAGVNSLSIDYQGNAHVCGLYREQGISFLSEDISNIRLHLKNVHAEHECIMLNSECNKCRFRNICKWCPAYSNVYNGNETEKVSFFCDLAKARSDVFGKR